MTLKRTALVSLIGTVGLLATACAGGAKHTSYPASSGHYEQSDSTGAPGDAPSKDYHAPAEPIGDEMSSGRDYDYGRSDDAPRAPSPDATAQAPRTSTADAGGREAEARRPSPSPGPSGDPFSLLPKPKRQPGLATSWGERRHSEVTTAPFVRDDRLSPFAVGKLFYNDADGIAAMSDTLPGDRSTRRTFAVGSGWMSVGLRTGGHRFLTGFTSHGDNFVSGNAGERYTIVVRNHSPGRIEAVVSVDGLDVIDGKPASMAKRGYLIDPHSQLEIDGFRTSSSEVAAFRFGSVSSSYSARKHGSTRNVGVIGVAAFHERGDNPRFWGSSRSHEDVTRRHDADPFPQRFASPPR